MSDTRQLPTDVGLLQQWMPPRPDHGAYAQAQEGVRRLDRLIADVRAQLERRDDIDRALINDLVDTAINAEGPIEGTADRFLLADRPELTYRLERLEQARTIAARRAANLAHSDPIQLAWQEQCLTITHEWQLAQSADTPEHRVEQLVRFAESH